MCGRFVSASPPADLARYLDVDEVVADDLPASWNVAPTDAVYAVAERDSARLLGQFKWGLVPAWSKDAAGAARMINARAETLTKRFTVPFERHRCIVPADAFYEWERREDGTRQPYLIRRADGAPLTFAGLWDVWRPRDASRESDNDVLRTCTIITTAPNELVARVHDRMPAVLAPSQWDQWLDRENHDTAALQALLEPADARQFEMYAVSTRVNSVRNNGPDLVEPLPAA